MLNRICKYCCICFETDNKNRKYCSEFCFKLVVNKRARDYQRIYRKLDKKKTDKGELKDIKSRCPMCKKIHIAHQKFYTGNLEIPWYRCEECNEKKRHIPSEEIIHSTGRALF